MVSGKTKSGFEFKVNEKLIKSWKLTKAVKLMASKDDKDQLAGTVDFVEILLGNQEEAMMKCLEDEDGIVATADIVNEAAEILDIVSGKDSEVKN